MRALDKDNSGTISLDEFIFLTEQCDREDLDEETKTIKSERNDNSTK